ncbi:glycosyltransferase family 4 protein [Bythopirellula polymerisocia]|uniref:Alpha-D-kanosaminyltransferase n=1 Tax=Bythopirellula polymerisocia TaxID=2528003 RepID=A0A5C6CN24_9BACT|nr:glycosyltransferase family 4 protein [Bythopirellula polymerisocia]TWU25802.1 Alpha-D-kanosaminyltransferase [Bythopirellula polymerisocia]
MKILFFSHYFPPEVNAPATRTYEHCRRWVAAGHEVTVVTCVPNCPEGVPYEGYRSRLRRQVEMIDGIRVVRIWTFMAANARSNRRIANYSSYFLSAVWTAISQAKPDVVVATSPQFFCGWAGVWGARLKRVPLVLEIRDIWPDSIAAVGAMRKGKRIRFLEWLERRMYLAAKHIVAVGTGYRDVITGKVPSVADRMSVITNGVDGEQFRPQAPCAEFSARYGLEGKFVCSYVGTVGMAHGLEVMIQAAERLRELGRTDIVFLIVGGGAEQGKLEQLAQDKGVAEQVVFTGRLGKEEMPKALATSDCCLVHLHGTELFATVIPSKIFEAMAMQLPIVMGVRGPALEIVMEAGAGVPMTPEADEELVEILLRLADDPHERETLGQNAREYVLKHYGRDRLAGEYLNLLERVVGEEGARR